ncbi:hypothetical protein Tsubulata_014702 [Turnera subulata]|uniref:Protein kinase domain-containing protein n=1 Tax=Turnera subulata TaxID=218843 RepID=A0A9Q0FLN3_9ROSI|nr:hypothetical protein Tsubulata_014702 [Turnera subulata]
MMLTQLRIFSFFLLLSVSLSNPDDFTILLSFKSSISDPSNSLSSWIVSSTNPCLDSWLGVTCNPTTHRVTKLVLESLNLTGPIHSLTELTQLRLLSLKHNDFFSGNLNFSSWTNIKHLYLSHNRLSGQFPAGIINLRRLRRLDFSNNYFYGDIPITQLAVLPHLMTLRLEYNSFTGAINSGGSVSSFSEFNVSNNNLAGEIPAWLSGFPASAFAGNNDLCGKPLMHACYNRTLKSEPARATDAGGRKRARNEVVLLLVSIDAVAIVAALVGITCCCYYFKKRRASSGVHGEAAKGRVVGYLHNPLGGFYGGGGSRGSGGGGGGGDMMMVVFDGCCKRLGYVDDLLKSSAELLGKGCVGTTYKVVMDGGDVAVVKRVRERRKRKEVDGWLRVVGGLRHCNVVSLRAYYNSSEELLLVYDYLPNGSLHSLLHGNRGPGRTPLDWTTRLKLASDSAKGLAFLHGHNNKAKLFHGNLTSSNIIVDCLGNACISDIGLYQLLHAPSLSDNGYRAPELIPSNNNVSPKKFTQKCDVYSFGVVLLEILTGKMPGGEGETGLVRWVQRVAREEWTWEVFDFELFRYKEMEEEMVGLVQIALLCLAPLPRDRPKMSMVHTMIEDIRNKGGGKEDGPNSIMNDLSSESSSSSLSIR